MEMRNLIVLVIQIGGAYLMETELKKSFTMIKSLPRLKILGFGGDFQNISGQMFDKCVNFVEDMKSSSKVEKMVFLPKGFNKVHKKKLNELSKLVEKNFRESRLTNLEEMEI
jgi:hypothetical protein